TDSHRDQQAHRWVEAVKKAEPRERKPRPHLSRGYAHVGACRGPTSRLVPSGIAIGIRRAVASLQPDLMRPMAFRPIDEEFRVERDASGGVGVEFSNPAVDAFRIEWRIDRAVERVGEITAPSVAADLDHLRSAVELSVLGCGVARTRDDPANAHLAGELRG